MPFVKGVSGNPSGKAKAVDAQALARQHARKAIATLVKNLKLGTASSRNAAAIALLERAYGKPQQPLVGSQAGGPIIYQVKWQTPPPVPGSEPPAPLPQG
jgi:hypothetical protein